MRPIQQGFFLIGHLIAQGKRPYIKAVELARGPIFRVGILIATSASLRSCICKGVYVDAPKAEDSDRYLKVSRTAILILLEYKSRQDSMREKAGDAWQGSLEDDRVFTNDVGRPWFPTSLTQWMGRFIKRTGLPSSCVHSLRHTYASLLIAKGTPLVVVSKNPGHAQTSTTSDIYTHVIASAEAKAAQLTDNFAEDIHPKFTPKAKKRTRREIEKNP